MPNNFEQIKKILKFDRPDMFYYIQLLRRQSDDPKTDPQTSKLYHGNMHSRSLKNYCIYSLDELEKYEKEIISLCDQQNCRAYIRLNRRSDEKVSTEMYEHIYTCMKGHTFKRPTGLLPSAIGKANAEPKETRSWLVDLDLDDLSNYDAVLAAVAQAKSQFAEKIMHKVKTKHGIHLITHPFNKRDYENYLKALGIAVPTIHEDNPTILYAP